MTCQRQPALGCVYKLVEINGQARIKLSQDVEKVTMPGNKNVYRLYSNDGHPLIDLIQKNNEPAPAIGQKVLCRHPFQESKRAYVIPSRVESLYKVDDSSIFMKCSSISMFIVFYRFIGKMEALLRRCQRLRKYVIKLNHRFNRFATITNVR